jgi:hypothetical protein
LREDPVVQEVEKLAAELKPQPLVQLPDLADRRIPILKLRAAEDITSHIAKGSDCIGIQHGPIFRKATTRRLQGGHQSRGVGGA